MPAEGLNLSPLQNLQTGPKCNPASSLMGNGECFAWEHGGQEMKMKTRPIDSHG